MIESLISPEGGLLSGVAMNVYNHWREKQEYRRKRKATAEETSKEQGQAGIAYGTETFHWIKRSMAIALLVNFFVLQYLMIFEPGMVKSLMWKFNRGFFFGGQLGIALAFVEASLFFTYSVVSYYLVSVVRHR